MEKVQHSLTRSSQRLASGLRINSAADDAAGLAISLSMEALLKSANQGMRNAGDGVSLAQTVEVALARIFDNLIRVRELAVQAATDTLTVSNRRNIQAESDQLISEVQQIADTTRFNGKPLLNAQGSTTGMQVGLDAGNSVTLSLGSAEPDNLGLKGDVLISGNLVDTASLANDAAAFNGANSLIINGQRIQTQDDGISGSFGFGSALALANGINAAGIGGLTATAQASSVNLGSASLIGVVTPGLQLRPVDFSVNGVAIGGVNWDPAAGTSFGSAVATKINATVTGVTASYTSGQLVLSADDGRSFRIGTTGGSGDQSSFSNFNINDGIAKDKTAIGEVVMTTSSPIQISHGLSVAAGQGRVLVAATYPYPLSSPGALLSAKSAQDYLQVVDASLGQVSGMRSQVGTVQNVLRESISAQQNTAQCLTEARSRIVDADMAVETADMTKSQIVQQAGIAMLAQSVQNARHTYSLLLLNL